MTGAEKIINETKRWINDVVVGCNFCPFAANTVKRQNIYYKVEESIDKAICLEALLTEVTRLDDEAAIETSFLIFPNTFKKFDDYLDIVSLAEKLLKKKGYEGTYQLASFHPLYIFTGSSESDAANYINRSVYPMLHLLRESGIDKALERYGNPEDIPERNINFAREKGLVYMKMLRESCL